MTSIYYRTRSKKTGRYTWVKVPDITYYEGRAKTKVTEEIRPNIMIRSDKKGKWEVDFKVDGLILLKKIME